MSEIFNEYNEKTYRLLRGLRRTNPELDPSFIDNHTEPQQKRRTKLVPVYENAILAHCIKYGEFWYSQITGHEIVYLDDVPEKRSHKLVDIAKYDDREAHDVAIGRDLDTGAGNLYAGDPDAGFGDPDAGVGDPDAGAGGLSAGAQTADAGDPDAGACDTDADAGDPDTNAGDPNAGAGDLGTGDPDADACDTDADAGDPDTNAGDPDAGAGSLGTGDPDADAGDTDADAGDPDTNAGYPDAGAGGLGTGDPDADAGDTDADAGDPDADSGDPDADAGDPDVGAGGLSAGDTDADAGDPDADAGDTDFVAADQVAGAGLGNMETGSEDLNVCVGDLETGARGVGVAVDIDTDPGDLDTCGSTTKLVISEQDTYTYDEYCMYKKYDTYRRKAVKIPDARDKETGCTTRCGITEVGSAIRDVCAYKKNGMHPRKDSKKPGGENCFKSKKTDWEDSFEREVRRKDASQFSQYQDRTYRLLRGLRRTDPVINPDIAESKEKLKTIRTHRVIPIYSQPVLVHCIRYGEFLQWKLTGHKRIRHGELIAESDHDTELHDQDTTHYDVSESHVSPLEDMNSMTYIHYKKYDTYEIKGELEGHSDLDGCESEKGTTDAFINSTDKEIHEFSFDLAADNQETDITADNIKAAVDAIETRPSAGTTSKNAYDDVTTDSRETAVVDEYTTEDDMAPTSQHNDVDVTVQSCRQSELPPVATQGHDNSDKDAILKSDDDEDDYMFGLLGVYARGQ